MTTSRSTKHSLLKGMIIYAIVFLAIIILGLSIFYMWAKSYEESRPTYAISKYINNLTEEHVKELSSDFLSQLNGIMSEDECANSVYSILKTSSPAKDIANSSADEQVYFLKNGTIYIEKVTLVHGEKGMFGFTPWIVSSEELLTSDLVSSASLSVPNTWSVKSNGNVLPSSFIQDKKSNFKILEGFYDEYPELPVIVTYSTGLQFGDTNVVAVDPNGNEYSPEELSETLFTDNCTEEEKNRLTAFCSDYIQRYVNYTSVGIVYGSGPLENLLELVDKNSILYKDIYDSRQGFGFASSRGDAVKDVKLIECMSIGNDQYVCRIEYEVVTYGSHERVTDEVYPMRLIISYQSGTPLAIACQNY